MKPRIAIFGAILLALLAAGGAWLVFGGEDAPEERLPIPPLPPRVASSSRYQTCLDSVDTDPSGAAANAEAWLGEGGGSAALHCLGLAKVALGDAQEGADVLQKAAEDPATEPAARASVYGQTAQAWMMAGDISRAYSASTLALTLAPDDADLLVDHAISAASLGDYQTAIDDLGHALVVDPQRTDALVLRGSAWRHQGDLLRAQDDVDRALSSDPDNPEALLERGILRQRRNDPAGARQDWERAIAVAPDSPAADLAQQNLALLEAGPSR
jgi:tetratricopeptide (TPR) repeat protein